MFEVRANGWNLNVQFEHEKFENPVDVRAYLPEVTKERYASHISRCYIFSPEVQPDGSIGETVLGYGFTLCSVTDNFSYERGREQAMKAALEDNPVVFDKATRTAVWNAYFTTLAQARLLSFLQKAMKATSNISKTAGISTMGAVHVTQEHLDAMDKLFGDHSDEAVTTFVNESINAAFQVLLDEAKKPAGSAFPTLDELRGVPPIPYQQ